ncbi:MAG TPA: alcohol dehydrogenase catalytic domain-containing protein, partial [Chloroflexota bacterium]
MHMRAVVFRKPLEPVNIETVDIDRPLRHEVLVRTVASGVCHSDLHVANGTSRYAMDRPILMGHEGAGIVEEVGDDVTEVAPGDHVVSCPSGFCGACAQCLAGHPNLCVGGIIPRARGLPPRLAQAGQELWPHGNIGSLAERMLLHEHSLVRIDPDIPLDRAALVGCGVLTGLGAALRTAGLEAAQTVAVFGCGGVGLSII